MYKVIETFDDLMDTMPTKEGLIPHRYEKGDMYPRPGTKPTMARIAELAGNQNLRGMPLIAPIVAPIEAREEASGKQVEEVPTEKVKRPRKRRKADARKD